jgi:hypothetical protein
MGKFLAFLAVGFVAGATVDFLWGKSNGGFMMLGQAPNQHPGFIPLETPRSTLVNGSASSLNAARLAYLSRGRQGLGEIDYFLT